MDEEKKTTTRKTLMGTLFLESLKKLEADMETTTKSPLSLLQLSMRFPSFVSCIVIKYNSGTMFNLCLIEHNNIPLILG